ncbi:Aste57867_14801 [Aphanomyces stellatus]|uniref:Aste57867_14801 protein n=1 Tax=Aphanomyces stellatus TaxID=120398 RepID=A0A485L1X3_9STRA|nr:hypothetical protein As57867_014746 [Aphanomyces stellatus]VFT91619.1 Aste57867_14801 [Aphanomyces stellatus]
MRGKCLDAAWVAATAATYNLDPHARDTQLRLVEPTLRPALRHPRYILQDARQQGDAFRPTCMPPGEVVRGVGELVYPNGSQASPGNVLGTLTIELCSWPSHALTTGIMMILIQEVIGYDVSVYATTNAIYATERMSAEGRGLCTPTHLNAEVWPDGKLSTLNMFANETIASSNGYVGQSGLYTLTKNVQTALNGSKAGLPFTRSYSADFWREFVQGHSNDLVNFYSIQKTLNLARIAQPSQCLDGTMGCRNGCAKNDACTAAEAAGKTCMLVAMMGSGYDPGYFQALVSNNNIPAYFCFAGYDAMNEYVVDTLAAGGSIVFYHYEPDLFHIVNANKFTRIAFPPSDPENVFLATGTFGELGYGKPTTNPVRVDFPESSLMKYFASSLASEDQLFSFISKFSISPTRIKNLLTNYAANVANTSMPNPSFATSCKWVRTNWDKWSAWVDPLPLCTLADHMNYTMTTGSSTTSTCLLTFIWTAPDPDNASLPYTCDRGFLTLPPPLLTTKSCDWMDNNVEAWQPWLSQPPRCDRSHFNYSISDCTEHSRRQVTFFWYLPRPNALNTSLECVGGVTLPPNATIHCDYVPFSATAFHVVATLCGLSIAFLAVLFVLVLAFRERPVIKRSQWPLLLLILLGGVFLCLHTLLTAGTPTDVLCAARPLLGALAFSLVFTALLVKSLRVYLLFNNKSMKKVTVSLWKMMKLYFLLVGIDVGTVVAGLVFDFPHASISIDSAVEFDGTVDHLTCHSSNFIFSAITIFFQLLLVGTGIYLAYLIRHADADFQETIWIVASAVVVVVGGLVMLPVEYLIEMPGPTQYVIESAVQLVGLLLIVGFIIGPKLWRLGKVTKSDGTTKPNPTAAKPSKGIRPQDKVAAPNAKSTSSNGLTTDKWNLVEQ